MFSLPFAFIMAVSGLWAPFWLPQLLGPRLGLATGILFALMALALAGGVAGPALRALREKDPALIIDARAITDNFHLHRHLPWGVIASAAVDLGEGGSLVLVLRPGARLPGGEVARARFWRRLFHGGDLSIPLAGLVYDQRRLREALKAHLALQASDKTR